MGFFNPALMWFALGGAIPVIIHLLHRQKYRRVRWAAMEFLLAALKKTQRRLRIENLLLLLIRVLIMIALALALARPFFREAPLDIMAESDTHHIFVIDNSYSMGFKKAQESYLDVAKKTAQKKLEEIRKLTEQDKMTVLLMSSYPEVYVAESNKKDLVHTRLGEIRLSHYGTSAFATFQKIREVVDKSRNQEFRIYVFTDFQRIAWEAADEAEGKRFAELTKALTARERLRVQFVDVASDQADNRGVVDLKCENAVVTMKSSARFSAQLHNWSSVSYPAVDVNIRVNGVLHSTQKVALPANSSANLSFRYDFVEPGAHYVQIDTEQDYLGVDDHRSIAVEVRDGLTGVLVDGETGNTPWSSETDYLKLVLDTTSLFKIDRQVTPEMFEADRLDKHDFVVLANVQSLTPEKVERLERFVRNGGGLMVALGGRVDRGWYNEQLWKEGKGLLPAQIGEVTGTPPDQDPRVPVRIQTFDTGHPIFRTFRKGLEKQPRELIFYQYHRLAGYEPGSVIAEYDDSVTTPLWVEKRVGDGRVLLYNSTLDDGWNLQVPGRVPYVVMMIAACEHLAARPGTRRNLYIGDFIAMQMTADLYKPEFQLEDMTNQEGVVGISPGRVTPEDPTFWVRYPPPPAERPAKDTRAPENEGLRFRGLYKLDKPDGRPDERPISYFAVNLPPRSTSAEELHRAEGNLDKMSEEEIRRRLPDFKFEIIGKKGETTDISLAPPASGLWKYLMYALLILLGLESMLAWVFGRAKQ